MTKKPKETLGTKAIISELGKKLQVLRRESKDNVLSSRARRILEADIREVMEGLGSFLSELDPIKQPTAMFDPSNPKVVGRFVSLALVAQERQPLSDISRFYGSGVYAIYYAGKYPLYAPLKKSETPIYVGQASPTIKGARTPTEQGDKLSNRLEEHRKNISRAASLSIADFDYRALVVQSGWETAAEDYLIHLFHPIWNSQTKLIFGLGKHGDSAETRANKRSPWDSLHPGRNWAANKKLRDAKGVERIKTELKVHFEKHPVFSKMDSLLASFIEELKQV